jgi:DNA invertase Pin-like site-specific DNA recombinase
VGFVSLTEALDMTTAPGRAMTGLLSVLAQFEYNPLRERVRSGLAEARLNGKELGRPRTMDAPRESANSTSIAPASAKPRSLAG